MNVKTIASQCVLMLSKTFVFLVLLLQLGLPIPAQSASVPTENPKVTVVLAGGGAKGFAHLAVLRRLEQDGVKISKIVGTSMGAVIGGLYACGMSTEEIERVIGGLDPAKIALDLIERSELSNRDRAYQQQYPIAFNFGIKNGQVNIARGFSDGQRFLALLQKLTSNVPTDANFDTLKIPFRAVATRSRDGELQVFKNGSLPLAIRASMAAPGVFAPIEIEGETYLDGGLVANLPIEVALEEGADVIVASYLKNTGDEIYQRQADNALAMADRMLDILIKQNERRNLKLLRPQDILVSTYLPHIEFTDFNKAAEIIQIGEASVQKENARFKQLATQAGGHVSEVQYKTSNFQQREIRISTIKVQGSSTVTTSSIEEKFTPLIGTTYKPEQINELIENLYLSGDFERINYSLNHLSDEKYELNVDVNEKTYGPNYFKTNIGVLSESNGSNLFSIGLGYRRPWLNAAGLEAKIDARIGTDEELTGRLYQPVSESWGLGTFVSHKKSTLPLYSLGGNAQKIAYMSISSDSVGARLSYDIDKRSQIHWSLINNRMRVSMDTPNYVSQGGQDYVMNDIDMRYSASRLEFTADQLDAPTFATTGHYMKLMTERGIQGSSYSSQRAHLKWANHLGAHGLTLGLNMGRDRLRNNCDNCVNPNSLYLGGFQAMGAFKFGQLMGDNLTHAQATYSYRLSDGGILRQKTYLGFVAEVGDAWSAPATFHAKHSQTVFVGIDSKLGDIYLGIARGSEKNSNVFLQLGRHFSY